MPLAPYIKWSEFDNVGDIKVSDVVVGMRAGVDVRFTFPSVGILDADDNYLFKYASAGAASVNYLTLTSSISGIGPSLTSAGSDSNIDILINPKGSGQIKLDALKWPLGAGTSGYVLTTNGTTDTSWVTLASLGAVTSVTGTANRITISGTATAPIVDISAAYVGQATITTLGTVATGTWNASVIGLSYGGTNKNLTASISVGGIVWCDADSFEISTGTATAGQILRSGASATPTWSTSTYPATNAVNTLLYASSADVMAALPTGNDGVLITSGAGVPSISSTLPSAVQGNITSVGTIASGTWQGGVIGMTYGGTSKNLSPSAGGIVWTDGDSMEVLAGTATAGQMLRSGASVTPSWSTATFPATATGTGTILIADGTNWIASTPTFANTYAVSTILYASASNTVTGLAAANRAVLTSGATGIPVMTALATDGYLIIGSTAGAPAAAALTQGTGITIANGSNSITISSATGAYGLTWSTLAGTSTTAVAGNAYVIGNAATTTITTPAVCAVGDTFLVQGLGAGGWVVQLAGGDIAHVGAVATSAGGTVTSSNQYDAIALVCVVANSEWSMLPPVSALFGTT